MRQLYYPKNCIRALNSPWMLIGEFSGMKLLDQLVAQRHRNCLGAFGDPKFG